MGQSAYMVFKAGQSIRRGTPGGQTAVVVHQPAQRVLHAAKGGGNLDQLAELNGAAEKSRCRHHKRKHRGRLAKKVGEPDQVFLLFDEFEVVGQHR